MKPDIHPNYHEMVIVFTDGSTFTTRSTYGKPGDKLLVDIDYKTHPAWTGGTSVINQKASKVASFNRRFSGINAFSSQKSADNK